MQLCILQQHYFLSKMIQQYKTNLLNSLATLISSGKVLKTSQKVGKNTICSYNFIANLSQRDDSFP